MRCPDRRPFGADSVIGAEGPAAANITRAAAKFPRDKADFAALAAQVVRSQAQAVLYIGSSGTVASGVKALRAAGSSAQVVTLSNNASKASSNCWGARPWRHRHLKCFPTNARSISADQGGAGTGQPRVLNSISPAMMEGFAAAKVLVEGLRRAGSKPTPASLRDALEDEQVRPGLAWK